MLSPSLSFTSFTMPTIYPNTKPSNVPTTDMYSVSQVPLINMLEYFCARNTIHSNELLGLLIIILLPHFYLSNTFLLNLKMTSVLNVIAVQELFMAAKTVGGNYYKYFESYLVIAVIYFVLCFVFDKLFKLIEKKLQGKTDYALAVEYMDNE